MEDIDDNIQLLCNTIETSILYGFLKRDTLWSQDCTKECADITYVCVWQKCNLQNLHNTNYSMNNVQNLEIRFLNSAI